MPERVFLCGLSKKQAADFPGGVELSHAKQTGNLNLELERMRKRLAGREPRRLTDFIEVASFVFAADRVTSRGPLTDPGFGSDWRRNFRLVIAVRDLRFWSRVDVKETLSEVLGFLSEDNWQFEFVDNLHPIPLQEFLPGLKPQEVDAAGGTSIVLFSGGLDSLAGAVHELRNSNRYVVLVSHRNLPGVGRRQKALAEELIKRFPRRVCRVWVNNNLTGIQSQEETQRTRSFFFTAMGAVAAHIEKADRIRFFENGIMSVNLPLAAQVVGARSSRSTHPRSLQLLNRFVELLSLHSMEIDNPFNSRTKIEVVRELAHSPEATLISVSISCTLSRTANSRYQPHCGKCVQCLHRRISTVAGDAGAFDEASGYETDFLTGPRERERNRVMAVETVSLALDCANVSETDFLGRFSGSLSWVFQAYPSDEREGVAKAVFDLFRRHGRAVRQLLIEASKEHLPQTVDRTLSPNSLLALVLKSRLTEVSEAPISDVREPLPDVPTVSELPPELPAGLSIALDDKQQRVLIKDLSELKGPAIFSIVKLLVEVSLSDRSKAGSPERYTTLLGREIADQISLSDEVAVRQAIKRARVEIADAFEALGFDDDASQALIESTGRGYRLNPVVRILEPDDLNG